MPLGLVEKPEVDRLEERAGARSELRSDRLAVPFDNVRSAPAKLPLSTVETYLGSSGSSVRVSYQFSRCPFVALQSFDGRERRVYPANQLCGVDEFQIVRGERGQEAQADVGRRGSVCDSEVGPGLHVVRRKAVLLRRVERLEVPPRLPRDRQQKFTIRRRQRRLPARRRATQGERDDRRDRPRHEDRKRHQQRAGRVRRRQIRPLQSPAPGWPASP